MSKKEFDVATSRRGFVKGALGVVAAVPLAAVLRGRDAIAQDLPKVSEDDDMAKNLNYVHDASKSEMAGEGQKCANCQLFTGGDAEWGPCSLFPGKAVSAKGWCMTWVQKAG